MCKKANTIPNIQVHGEGPPPKGHWMVPFDRNEGFVGREDIMHDILERIPPNKVRDTCQRTVVEGLGGVGKTQIALEAAFRLRDSNPRCSVFWVPAIDAIGFENAYRRIADLMGIQTPEGENASTTAKVKEALSNENAGEWVLIIDNADDPKLLFNPGCLASYLPSSPSGSILFTTRTSEVTSGFDVISDGIFVTNSMSKQEATALMRTKLSVLQMEDTHSLNSLLEVLAYLPLALKQAASYMQKTKKMPSEYLQLCQSSDESFLRLLTKDFMDKNHSQDSDHGGQAKNAVAKTWLISFKHVHQLNPIAGEILEFLCFLSEKAIPLSILPPEYENLELNDAIGVLQSYAFITTREDGQFLDMHRLVRLATRNWLEEIGRFVQAYDLVLLRLNDLIPDWNLKDHSGWKKFMPHVQSVVSNNTRSKDLSARFEILVSFSTVLSYEQKWEVAVGLMQEAERIGSNIFHTELLSVRFLLAELLQRSGKISEAKDILQKNIQTSQDTTGEEDPRTLRLIAEQEFVTRDTEPAKAERILQQILQKQRDILGEEHEATVTTREFLLDCLFNLSKYTEAEEIARQLLRARQKDPGEEDIETTSAMLDLSKALRYQGLYEEAEQLARRSYLIRARAMGTNSRFTYDSLCEIADVLIAAGKNQEAEEEIRLLLSTFTKCFNKMA